MIPQEKLDALIEKFESIEAAMATASDSDEIIRLSKEHGELKSVVEKARELHGDHFAEGSVSPRKADYAVASGIMNVKLETPVEEWEAYVRATRDSMDAHSEKGFAFNCLTSYSDKEYMRDDLYYADPALYFDYCKRKFSRNVALLHDYELYEFTILVRKG